jgi:anti-sigma B factor antagonist
MEFRIDDYPLDRRTQCIEVSGELDLYTAPRFKERAMAAIEAGKTRVIVDLTGVSFVDSTALSVLVSALKRVRAQQGFLSLVVKDYDIERVLEISGLDGLMAVHRSRDEAIEQLAAQA